MNYFVLIKNAIANILRGGAAALVTIMLPPFLTRIMPTASFGAWMLILQLSGYVAYLDFGIQTAVGRFVAHANELGNTKQRNYVVSTSFAILTGSAGLSLLLIGLLSWQLPNLFTEMPLSLYSEVRVALLLVGGSLAIGLPFSVFNGIFIGLQRNELPAITIGGGKLLGALLVVLVAWVSPNIIYMGVVTAIANLITYGVQFLLYFLMVKDIEISRLFVSKQAGKEIFHYCFSLSIWSFATLLVLGFDTTIVGFFDFDSVAYYSIAASLITFILGIQYALFTVLIPAAAILEARGNTKELGNLLVTTTRYSMFLLLLTGLPLIVFAKNILSLWVGPTYSAQAAILLQILVIANIIRLSALPYAMLLIGTGQQRLVIISPLIEGFSNLFSSIIAAYFLGAKGVAIGTVIGSSVGVALNLFYNMPRTKNISANRLTYLKNGILYPIICTGPVIGVSILLLTNIQMSLSLLILLTCSAVLTTVFFIWHWSLEQTERIMVISLINKRLVSPLQAVLKKLVGLY